MKKISALILTFAIIFSFIGCNEAQSDEWGITLSVEDATPWGLTLVISQSGGNAKGTLEYGTPYRIEKQNNGKWEAVPYKIDNVSWTMQAFLLPLNQTTREEISWEWFYGNLPSGNYRVSKEFIDFTEGGEHEKKTYYAEFEIAPKIRSGFDYGEILKSNAEIWSKVEEYRQTKDTNPPELNELISSLAGGSCDTVYFVINVNVRDLTDEKIETFKKYIIDKEYIKFQDCDYYDMPT